MSPQDVAPRQRWQILFSRAEPALRLRQQDILAEFQRVLTEAEQRYVRDRPETLAGRWAELLFAFGLLNASLLAASILPLSTAQVICEGLGFEAGIDRKFREAPIFYWLYGILIVVGGGLILIPGAPLLRILVLSQVANGIWLPVVLIFMLKLINRRDLMGDKVNSKAFNAVAWFTALGMIGLTLVLIYFGVFRPGAAPVPGL